MAVYPRIEREPGRLEIFFSSCEVQSANADIETILDFDEFRGVIGIEILDIKTQLGKRCLRKIRRALENKGHGLSCGYDDETDSFYLTIDEQRSIYQGVFVGVLALDSKQQILSIRVNPDDTNSEVG